MQKKITPPNSPQPIEKIGDKTDAQIHLKESIERFEYVAKATSDAIWDWNVETNKVYTNEAFNNFFGTQHNSREELIKFIFSNVHPEDYAKSKEFLVNVMQHSGNFWTYECRLKKTNSEYAYIVNKATVIRDANGKVLRMIGAMQDVTKWRLYEQSLEKLNRDLRTTNNELEQFAYIASHDLQEPLRMISSFLGLIEKKFSSILGEKGREYIHYATDGANRMRKVISDILEFSKIGRIAEPNTLVDLNLLMKEICLLQKDSIKETKALIQYENLPSIQSQRTLLLQLFNNLLSNALKYKKSNTVPIVQINARETLHHWEFAVQDNGIGIDNHYYNKIFEAFQRLHSREEYNGSGIGLAICKKITHTLGGEIWVESQLKMGSTFYFTLPKS